MKTPILIKYYVKSVYGVDKMYVNDEDQRIAVRKITGQITLSQSAMDGLKQLGVVFRMGFAPSNGRITQADYN